ncbi:polyketide synthase [Cadophora gregata]|uniref:polyketide synthase n=1 Tax=Cadophora gregata TaxID=51156 RepID=UPI0026DB0446|nr:polyketide synthase [Cadophora gregata]KAK0120184.1 polyketide synthase [Cadophora gregata]
MAEQKQAPETVAIVGSACRFPGASSPSKLWDLLHEPRDVLKEFDSDRLNLKRFYHANGDTHGSTDVQNKSYLLEEDPRLFDASFFGISPVEAASMDPQQRLVLETAYEAFESAGVTLDQLKGSSTAVHVGVMTADYANIQLRDSETVGKYAATGNANSIISNRISYVFDLKGPSDTVDTACSSSLVALHNAAQGLLCGDSDAAIIAGVNLILDPSQYITESKLHMLSPDSRSRMWDKEANGYARGEGVAAIFIKTLSRALADGDQIEGILRSTGVNSDGQSSGITMPYAPAQSALIRQTYLRAGLDPILDRPQFFECHGTGTQAGDPVEARAISDSLVSNVGDDQNPLPLYVGSIKTVVGHLEGCAGLAGVLKVLLAIKNRIIPPNLLFNELNPAIAPYYGPLQIPTRSLPWPVLPAGVPRRASVNSFGFGGTNAHAIIESYDIDEILTESEHGESREGPSGPLLYSAQSGNSLLRTVRDHLEHMRQNPSLNLQDLSWVLQVRRSTHRFRTHFSGLSRESVMMNMSKFIDSHAKLSSADIGHQPRLVNLNENPAILGIFTGQGAQWPAMGKELMDMSPLFRRTIEKCEAVLNALPRDHAPAWSLQTELLAHDQTSRLSEAAISQPLCTAVQIALIELLAASGISFDAVVGHSSGEIAATYASGIINLKGAMQIAYYRGFYANLAIGTGGERGGMLAVGMSLEAAAKLCRQERFDGRLHVAASNSHHSVTLSGDIDAINAAKEKLQAEEVFARPLKVDTAYHSHHMKPCAEPYLQSLLACDIEVTRPRPGTCIWNSSVRGNTELLNGDLDSLKGPYWVANMVNAVLFSQAVESSIWHGGPFDLAVEVGPHPALKGPAEQTFKAAYGQAPVYVGVLKRNTSDVEAFTSAIGEIWAQLGPKSVDFAGVHKAFSMSQPAARKMLKALPKYSWDHDKVYWRESRVSRRYRTGKDCFHELLGRRTPDDNDHELRWRNILKLSELTWLRGHEVLQQVLMPGAGYISIAVEAGKQLAAESGKSIRLLEVENMDILRPVVVPDDNNGVETLFTLRIISPRAADHVDIVRAQFSYYVCIDESKGSMFRTSNGELVVHLGLAAKDEDSLPVSGLEYTDSPSVDSESYYSRFQDIGLNYSGPFRSITEVNRSLKYATATAVWAQGSLSEQYVVHPAMLDVAFQTMFMARAHPASRQIAAALLPSHIDRVRVNPDFDTSAKATMKFETWVVQKSAASLTGDLNVFHPESGKTLVQVEGLLLKQRVALYYMKRILNEFKGWDKAQIQWYHQRMFKAFETHMEVIQRGEHPILPKEWLADDATALEELEIAHGATIELELIHAVGKSMASVVRGEQQLLDVMLKDDMLNNFYMNSRAFSPINQGIAEVMQNITFKYARCKILEIGAGTGGTTWSILNQINNAYESYTYTDISAGFFPQAATKFANFAHTMIFKTLDIEKEPSAQGFPAHSYDVIVVANVLHATRNLQSTLQNVRRLLRPGGYLVMMETTGTQSVRVTLIFGGLPGWWMSEEPDRQLTPAVSAVDWDVLLQDNGFSGADTVIHDLPDESKHLSSLIVSQAVDDAFMRLREPLSVPEESTPVSEKLLLIGGKKLLTSKLLAEIQKVLPRQWKSCIQKVSSIDDIDLAEWTTGMNVICLHDIDESLFANFLTVKRMANLQRLLMSTKNLLWVTTAGKCHTPRGSMFLGIARVVPSELPHLNVQVLGLESGGAPAAAARHCIEALLRLREKGGEQVDEEKRVLWSHEPEINILADGSVIIPRVQADTTINMQYNASTRSIINTVNATRIPVQAVAGASKMMLQAVECIDESGNSEPFPRSRIQVQYSLHVPSRNGRSMYLVCGVSGEGATECWFMALSLENASVLDVNTEDLVPIDRYDCTPEKLAETASHMFLKAIIKISKDFSKVLCYGAEESLAASIASRLSQSATEIHFASSSSSSPQSWIRIHEQSSRRATLLKLPSDINLYIDCNAGLRSAESQGSVAASQLLRACLPTSCVAFEFDAELLQIDLADCKKQSPVLLRNSYQDTKNFSGQERLACDVIAASNLSGVAVSSLLHRRYVTDWRQRESLPLTIRPMNLDSLFKPDKTYLMVGAAGGLGLSICRWMIANGAKFMVITSRNPQPDAALLEDARRAGALIRVMKMDVAQKGSVDAVVQSVRNTMPPIVGVCNAAMVLADKLFLDMTVDQFNGALAPKVLGTENLDTVFAKTPLDFFILLSSAGTVIGNVGQSNYHAANILMGSLVAQRRARGLAASLIHVGYIADVGYVTRQAHQTQLQEHFRNVRLMALSETDVHHAFAQAIKGGKPGSSVGSHEIVMGIEPPTEPLVTGRETPWLVNPQFTHFVPNAQQTKQIDRGGMASSGNIKRQVIEAPTEDDAIAVVLEAFCKKLEFVLQLPAGSVKDSAQRAVIDLGIDSLVAVEIRTWFIKELGAEVPVLKILGGDTVLQICVLATKKVMAANMKTPAVVTPNENPVPKDNTPAAARKSRLSTGDIIPAETKDTGASPSQEFRQDFVKNALDSDSTSGTDSEENSIGSIVTSRSAGSSVTGDSIPKFELGDKEADLGHSDEIAAAISPKDMRAAEKEAVVVETIHEGPMSAAQARIWFMSKHQERPTANNMVFHYHVIGPLNMARLRHALTVATQRHESLRTRFNLRLGDGQPMQGVVASSLYVVHHIACADESDLRDEIARMKAVDWNLEKGHTFEVTVLGRTAEEHDIVFGYHHIIMDVMGWYCFVRDLDKAYRMHALDTNTAGSPIEYARVELEQKTKGSSEQVLFWQNEFATLPEPQKRLPFARLGTSTEQGTYDEYRELDQPQLHAIKRICQNLRISLFHFHLAVFQVLLARYESTEDVCIGVIDANRNDPSYAQTVGCFVNVLPIRSQISRDASFSEIAKAASQKALKVFANTLPFDMILDKVKARRSADTTPLFQAAINYRTGAVWDLPLGECKMKLSLTDGKDADTPYDISLGISETGSGCVIEMHCLKSKYTTEGCLILLDSYHRLLSGIIADENVVLRDLAVADDAQVSRALELGRGPEVDFRWPATLSQRFSDICRLHARENAITDQAGTISYSHLAARVNVVADTVLRIGCSARTRVAVLCEPSLDAIVAMLAILHIGAVYVPLDTSLPTARHVAIVQSCKPALLLSHRATEGQVEDLLHEMETPAGEAGMESIAVSEETECHRTVACSATPDACAILLFTSGSTGTPKGILLSQANFVNHIALKTEALGLKQECVLQQSSLGFDMSLIQIFCALANGGRLVIAPSTMRKDPVEMAGLVNRSGISLTIATPSEYLAWMRYGMEALRKNMAWRHACMGGEQVSRQLKIDFRRLGLVGLQLTNCYGPTEITAAATFQPLVIGRDDGDDDDDLMWSVGKAIPNYSVCILDDAGRPQPLEHTGEICIGGRGVAAGYLNLPDQTALKFITNMSGSTKEQRISEQRIYRTGDCGRLLPDGTLLCFGRLDGDTQIKLRGLRIDLQEVESALMLAADGLFKSTVVCVKKDVLIAYATLSTSTAEITEENLRGVLARLKLPQAFCPATIVILPTFPTTSNGKLDRKKIGALPLQLNHGGPAMTCSSLEKMTVREGELRLLWERVLGQATTAARIVPSSDFFLCGGNSLLLMKLQAAIKESMEVAISTKVLYQTSTLREMAKCIEVQRHELGARIEQFIDWPTETAIPSWLLEDISNLASSTTILSRKKDGIEVLLTGATSFLGSRLLRAFVRSAVVRKVHCVAVLGDDQHLLCQDEKVHSYTGSLLSSTLGLSISEKKNLEQTIDVVIHAGSNGHCLNTYQSLRAANLLSTHFIVSLALPRSIPILFLSSNRVALLSGNNAPIPGSVASFAPSTDGREGYTATKWASEVFLERIVTQLQTTVKHRLQPALAVSIHRPCVIVSEDAPNSDALNEILRYSVLMRCIPRMKRAEGYLDFGQVDTVVDEIVGTGLQLALGQHEDRDMGASIHFRHHSGKVKTPISQFQRHMENVYGGQFEAVDVTEWMDRATQAGLDPLIAAYLEGVVDSDGPLVFPYMGEE